MTKKEIQLATDHMPETFNKVMDLAEEIEKKNKVELVIYQGYCYWLSEDGQQLSDEINGDDRLDAIYNAVRWFINNNEF
jgi:hypothetical protein